MLQNNCVCIAGILVVISGTFIQAKLSRRGGVIGSRLGESCEYDDDCDVVYSYCRAQQTCECKRGFTASPTRDSCIANIGAICQSYYDCKGLANSECSQEVCTCKSGYVPHPTMKECLKVASNYQEACVEPTQCVTAFGDRVTCVNNKCECIPMHHFSNGVCIPSKGLDQMCTSSEECHVSDTDVSKNEQVECTGGRCQCIMGFHVATDGITCTNGAGQFSSLSLLSISTLMYVLSRLLH